MFNSIENSNSWTWQKNSIIHREKFIKLCEYGEVHPQSIQEINDVRVCFLNEFLIGRGCDGTRVYIGLDKDGRERAVKHLPKDDRPFLAEQKKILNQFNAIESSHVVKYQYLDNKKDDDCVLLIMDLCEETLKDYVERSSSEKLSEIAPNIIQQVLKGLKDLHCEPKRILHRDLKPSNILQNVHNEWLLADFGISRVLTQDESTLENKESVSKDWIAVESCSSRDTSNDAEVCYKMESDIQVQYGFV